MKYKIGFLGFILTLASGYAGYINYNQSSDHTSDPNIVSVHAAWGEEFADVEALSESSDLVVVATLKDELMAYQPFEELEDTFTDATINIEEVVKGDVPQTEVTISQYGGIRADGKLEVFEDLPLLEKDKKYLLFLEYIEEDSERNGKYQTIRGVQGYYNVTEEGGTFSAPGSEIESIVDGEINEKVTDLEVEELIDLNENLEQ